MKNKVFTAMKMGLEKKKWFVCLFGTNKNIYPSLPVELVVENGAREEAGKDVVVTGAETKQKQNKTKPKMRNEIQIVIHL